MRREAAECRMGAVLIISPPARMTHWSTSGGSPAALRAAEVTEQDTCLAADVSMLQGCAQYVHNCQALDASLRAATGKSS